MQKWRCTKHQTIDKSEQTKCHASTVRDCERESRRASNQFKYKNKPFCYLLLPLRELMRHMQYTIVMKPEHIGCRENTPYLMHIYKLRFMYIDIFHFEFLTKWLTSNNAIAALSASFYWSVWNIFASKKYALIINLCLQTIIIGWLLWSYAVKTIFHKDENNNN